jgi:hypothetical protein
MGAFCRMWGEMRSVRIGCSPAAGSSQPSPLRGEGWDEGRVLRRPSWVFVLACRQVARLRRAFVRLPAPERLLFAGLYGPERSSQEKWPVEPADPASLVGRGVWNRQDTSCSTSGHPAPSPLTEGSAVLRLAALRSPQGGRVAPFSPCAVFPSSSFRRRPEAPFNRRRSGHPVAEAAGFRDRRAPTSLDPGLRRDDELRTGGCRRVWAGRDMGIAPSATGP